MNQMVSLVLSKWCEMIRHRIASSLITPPTLQIICISPVWRPSRSSTSSWASIQATTTTCLDGWIGCLLGIGRLMDYLPTGILPIIFQKRVCHRTNHFSSPWFTGTSDVALIQTVPEARSRGSADSLIGFHFWPFEFFYLIFNGYPRLIVFSPSTYWLQASDFCTTRFNWRDRASVWNTTQ